MIRMEKSRDPKRVESPILSLYERLGPCSLLSLLKQIRYGETARVLQPLVQMRLEAGLGGIVSKRAES